MQEELIKKLQKMQESLKEQLALKSPEENWYQEFLKDKDFANPLTYEKVNFKKFLMAYIRSQVSNYSLEQLEEITTPLSKFIVENDLDTAQTAINIIMDFAEPYVYPAIKPVLEDDNQIRKQHMLYKILEGYNYTDSTFDTLETMVMQEDGKLVDFIKEFVKYPEVWEYGLSIILAFKEISERQYILEKEYDLRMPEVIPKNKDLAIRGILEQEYHINIITPYCQKISKYYQKLQKKSVKEKNHIRKEISDYDKIIAKIKSLSKGPIVNFTNFLGVISNKDIRVEILKYIYQHNRPYYQALEEKYKHYKENSILNYQSLCQEYHLASKVTMEELTKKYSYNDLEWMIKTLTKLGIKDSDNLAYVLKTSTKAYTEKLLSLITKNLLTKEMVANNIYLLDPEENVYDKVEKNEKILISKNIRSEIYKGGKDMMLIEPERLDLNLEVLKEYDLLSALKTSESKKFLASNDLRDKIDLALELGLENLLVQNLGILNYEIVKFERLKLLKDLDIKVETKEDLERVLKDEHFIVPDNKIPRYIAEQEVKIEVLKSSSPNLPNLKETPRTYIFNGIIFSKNKLKRSMENNDSLFIDRKLAPAEYQKVKSYLTFKK